MLVKRDEKRPLRGFGRSPLNVLEEGNPSRDRIVEQDGSKLAPGPAVEQHVTVARRALKESFDFSAGRLCFARSVVRGPVKIDLAIALTVSSGNGVVVRSGV